MSPTHDEVSRTLARITAAGTPATEEAIAAEMKVTAEELRPILQEMCREGLLAEVYVHVQETHPTMTSEGRLRPTDPLP
jgi:Mn-dependent DtxR family transcriptional regulator